MKVQIISMSLKNFQKVESRTFEYNGENARLTGQNGAGKTTERGAFSWLFYDKDSNGDSNLNFRPFDSENNAIKGLVVAVEGIIDFDEKRRVFKKEHHERIVRRQFRGYTSKYWIDGVVKSMSEYKAEIAEILDEDVFKILTDPSYFNNDDKFHHSKRRAVLANIGGDVGTPAGFSELIAAVNGRSIKDYKKILKDRVKKYEEERDEKNTRIDEIKAGFGDFAGHAGSDLTKLESSREIAQEEINRLDGKRKALLLDEKLRQDNIENIAKLKIAKADREVALKKDTSGIKHLIEERDMIEAGVAEKRAAVTAVENELTLHNTKIVTATKVLSAEMASLAKVRDELMRGREATLEMLCSTCKRPVTPEMKAEIEASHHVAQVEIAKRATQAKTDVKTCKIESVKLDLDRTEILERLGNIGIELGEAEKYQADRVKELNARIQCNKPVRPEEDRACMDLSMDILNLEKSIGEPVANQLAVIETAKSTQNNELTEINDALSQVDEVKKGKERIAVHKAREKELGQKIADAMRELEDIKNYDKAECSLIEKAVNSKFKYVTFRLFKELLRKTDAGEIDTVPCCDALLDGVPYHIASGGEKVLVDLDINRVLSEYYGVWLPLFIDNAESFTEDIESDSQVIELFAKRGAKKIKFEIVPSEKESEVV